MNLDDPFVQDLIQLRKKFLFTQTRLAELLGIPHAGLLSQWESGRRRPPEIVRRYIWLLATISTREAEALLSKLNERNIDEAREQGLPGPRWKV